MFLFQFSNYATVVEPALSWLDYCTPCVCVKEFVYKLKELNGNFGEYSVPLLPAGEREMDGEGETWRGFSFSSPLPSSSAVHLAALSHRLRFPGFSLLHHVRHLSFLPLSSPTVFLSITVVICQCFSVLFPFRLYSMFTLSTLNLKSRSGCFCKYTYPHWKTTGKQQKNDEMASCSSSLSSSSKTFAHSQHLVSGGRDTPVPLFTLSW